MIALSSAEAEIMTMFACVRYVMFVRQLMEDMGEPPTELTVIYGRPFRADGKVVFLPWFFRKKKFFCFNFVV